MVNIKGSAQGVIHRMKNKDKWANEKLETKKTKLIRKMNKRLNGELDKVAEQIRFLDDVHNYIESGQMRDLHNVIKLCRANSDSKDNVIFPTQADDFIELNQMLGKGIESVLAFRNFQEKALLEQDTKANAHHKFIKDIEVRCDGDEFHPNLIVVRSDSDLLNIRKFVEVANDEFYHDFVDLWNDTCKVA
jgi:hypothetical protein